MKAALYGIFGFLHVARGLLLCVRDPLHRADRAAATLPLPYLPAKMI
ncbi:hypothetical protein [Bacteroides rodentium]|nr:hypothetical protein [Bacteroides rodentium]